MMQETQENVKESFIKGFLNRLVNSLGKADIDDSENVEYEKTAEFSMLSENDKAELLNAEKSINEKDVDYAGEVRKMMNKHNNLFVKTNMQDKIEANKTTKKLNELNEKEKKIADYYSKGKKSKKENEIEK